MSSDRKEPTLSSSTSTNTPKRSSANPGTGNLAQRVKPRGAPPARVVIKKEASKILWLTLLLALSLAAGMGYGFWQLSLTHQSLINQQQRIADLETRLELSGDESTQSLTTLTANLKAVKKDVALTLSEVDKLWATRNVNRKGISDNKQALENGQLSFANFEKSVDQSVKLLQQRTSEQEILAQSLRERFSEQQNLLENLRAQLAQSASKDDLAQMTKQLKAHDEAIEAIDKFRLTVNRDLLTLRQRLMQSDPPPASAN